jgi:Leucine-rich repeat (LRR) protein
LIRNAIGEAGAQALANGNFASLTSLDLNTNNIRDAGVQALAKGNLSALTFLDLGNNKIEDAGQKAIRAWIEQHIEVLDSVHHKFSIIYR